MARKLFDLYDFQNAVFDQNTAVVEAYPYGVRLRKQDSHVYTHAYPAAGDTYLDFATGPVAKGTFSISNGESGGSLVTGLDDSYGNIIGSVSQSQSAGAGDGSTVTFTGTFAGAPIGRGSIQIAVNPFGAGGGYDDGEGNLLGPAVSTGTVNYTTGAFSVTFLVAPTVSQTVDFTYLKSIGTVDYVEKNWLVTFPAAVTPGLYVTVQYKTTRMAAGGEYREGIVVFPTWTADALVELFGFYPREEHAYTTDNGTSIRLTEIRYQLSTDGGTTWLHWDGAAWSQATLLDPHWDPWEIVDEQIGNLKFTTTAGAPGTQRKSITVRAKLTPEATSGSTVNDVAPVLRNVSILHELAYEFEYDVLSTLKDYFDTNVRVLYRQKFMAQTAATSWTLRVHEAQTVSTTPAVSFTQPDFTSAWSTESDLVGGRVWFYNLTDDPHRTRPLRATINEVLGVVTKDGAVAAQNGVIEVWFYASVPTFVSADERIVASTSRALIVQIGESNHSPGYSGEALYSETEIEYSRLRVRKRVPSQVFQTVMTIRCQAPTRAESSSIVSAVQRLIATRSTPISLATGQAYIFQDYGYPEGEIASTAGLATESYHVVLHGVRFYPEYVTEYLTLEAIVSLSDTQFKTALGNVVTTQADL